MFIHLRGHLRKKETVPCPFRACTFKTNVYSMFNAHRCREHQNTFDYDDIIVQIEQDPGELTDENETTPVAGGSNERLAE